MVCLHKYNDGVQVEYLYKWSVRIAQHSLIFMNHTGVEQFDTSCVAVSSTAVELIEKVIEKQEKASKDPSLKPEEVKKMMTLNTNKIEKDYIDEEMELKVNLPFVVFEISKPKSKSDELDQLPIGLKNESDGEQTGNHMRITRMQKMKMRKKMKKMKRKVIMVKMF